MNLLFYCLFAAANYYLLFILPTKIRQKRLLIGLAASLVIFMVFSSTLSWFNAHPFIVGASHQTVWANLLSSIQILIMLSLVNQASSAMVSRVASFNQEHNASNLHWLLVRFPIEQQTTIQKVFTSFWLVSSLIVFYGIWLRA